MYLIDILKKFRNTFPTREHHSDSQHTANVRPYKLRTCRSLNIAVVCSSSLFKINDNILILSHLAFNLIFQYLNEFYHLIFVYDPLRSFHKKEVYALYPTTLNLPEVYHYNLVVSRLSLYPLIQSKSALQNAYCLSFTCVNEKGK